MANMNSVPGGAYALDVSDSGIIDYELIRNLIAAGMVSGGAIAAAKKISSMRSQQNLWNSSGGTQGRNWVGDEKAFSQAIKDVPKNAVKKVKATLSKPLTAKGRRQQYVKENMLPTDRKPTPEELATRQGKQGAIFDEAERLKGVEKTKKAKVRKRSGAKRHGALGAPKTSKQLRNIGRKMHEPADIKSPKGVELKEGAWESGTDYEEKKGTSKSRQTAREGAVYSQEQEYKMKGARTRQKVLMENLKVMPKGAEGSPEREAYKKVHDKLVSTNREIRSIRDVPEGEVDVKNEKSSGQKAKEFIEDDIGTKTQKTVDAAEGAAKETGAKIKETAKTVKKEGPGKVKKAYEAVKGAAKGATAGAKKVYGASASIPGAKTAGKVVGGTAKGVGKVIGGTAKGAGGAIKGTGKAVAGGYRGAKPVVGALGAAMLPAAGWGLGQLGHDAADSYQEGGIGQVYDDASMGAAGLWDQFKGFGQNIADIYNDPNNMNALEGGAAALGYAMDRGIQAPLEQAAKTVLNIPAIYGNYMLDDQDKYQVYDMESRGFDEVNRGMNRSESYSDFDPGQHYANIDRTQNSAPGTEGVEKAPPSGGTMSKAANEMPPQFNAYDDGMQQTTMGRTPVYSRDLTGQGQGQDREQFGNKMYGDTPASVNPDIMGVPGMLETTDDFRGREQQIQQQQQADYDAQLKMQADQAALIAMSKGKGMGTGEAPKGTPTPMELAREEPTVQSQAVGNMQQRNDMRSQGQVLGANQMADYAKANQGWSDMGPYDSMRFGADDIADIRAGKGYLSSGNTRLNLPGGMGMPIPEHLLPSVNANVYQTEEQYNAARKGK